MEGRERFLRSRPLVFLISRDQLPGLSCDPEPVAVRHHLVIKGRDSGRDAPSVAHRAELYATLNAANRLCGAAGVQILVKHAIIPLREALCEVPFVAHDGIIGQCFPIVNLDWKDMQELVAGILRAMGYKTMISPSGPDRGKDIIASPDGLGLEDPKIVVEVKHRKNSTMGAPEIRSLLGGLRPNDKSLYVSTGGFSKEARYEAERANNSLTLVDLDLLTDLIIQYYDQFDSESRTLLPLRKLYWPI